MNNINLHLGVVQNVNIQARTVDIIEISNSNMSTVNYRDVYCQDISEHMIMPQAGYTVLFITISAVPGTQSVAIPIKFFSSALNGDNDTSTKTYYTGALQAEGDQVLASNGGTSVAIQEQAVVINAGSQTIKLNKNDSQTVINYDSLQINGRDGFIITQDQGSNELVITKGDTKITLADSEINIVSNETINLNGSKTVNVTAPNVNIANEPTVKGQSLFNWLSNHQHLYVPSGSTTPVPTTTDLTNPLPQSVLVKEQ
jgi:hypothetical protein